ncbi:hypothetical protein [Streptomyces sp.]|uniref:hypothetical protein n=1 Tax=Streptomyces sp. TaxID=1931 RepID=UPI002811BE8F|nr:hypothetical protein [Streptomyces sp.]
MRYRPGDIVTDGTRALAGQVRDVHGNTLTLARPGGYVWEAEARGCWPASPEEREALHPRGALRLIGEERPARTAPPSS